MATPTGEDADDARLGSGVRFPLRPIGGRRDWLWGQDLVRQSIETISAPNLVSG
jgi:hypothetical protein